MLVLRIVTWTAIVINWILLIGLNWLLHRSRRRNDEMQKELMNWAVFTGCVMGTLHRVAPDTPVELPPDIYRWVETMHLEHMVYGDESE